MLDEDIEEFFKIIKDKKDVVIFYNSDADGISSALMIKKIIKGKFIPHPSAILTKKDIFPYLREGVLFIILDFGCGEESKKAAELIKDYKSIVIDHHPMDNKTIKNYSLVINSFKYYKNGSSYPTGWLVGKILEKKGIKTNLIKIACAGDKSNILKVNEEDKEIALAFDYAAFYRNKNIEFYENMLNDLFLLQSIIVEAKSKLEDAYAKAKKYIKIYKIKDKKIGIINLDKIIKKGEFPNRGKIATKFIEENFVDLILGYGKRMILIRNNGKLKIKEIIEKIKKNYNDLIISGGGHENAMAIRTKIGWERILVEAILEEIKNINIME